ncbi:MAG: EthD family reductase [Gemmatimonadota bacterium]
MPPTAQAAVVVLYHQPEDPAAFERYYADTHVPLVERHAAEIGFTRAELAKFTSSLDGSAPPYYRMAELWFSSEADLKRGIGTAGFRAVAADLENFATGGVTAGITVETKP